MNIIQGKIDCQPIETGFDPTRIDALNRKFKSLIERNIIHGVTYCIAHKGKVIAHAALGRDNGADVDSPMKPDTVFGIASITKLFTTTAIMQLVEDGLIRLDTYVGDILPQFAKKPFNDITLLHLLTHTSGLYPDGGCFEEAVKDAWDFIEEADKNKKEGEEVDWIAAGISGGLRRPTGAEWMYSSFGFTILGEIITKVSGQDVHDYIKEHVIKPLKMEDTGFDYTKETAGRSFYSKKSHKEYLDKIAAGEITGKESDGSIWERVPNTGGGLHSTVYDLVRFGNAYANFGRLDDSRILGRKTIEKMSTVQLHNVPDHCWNSTEPNRLYGIGFDMRQGPAYTYSPKTIMHEGAGASSIDIDLEEQLVAVWFVPWAPGSNGWSAEGLYNIQNIIWSGLI